MRKRARMAVILTMIALTTFGASSTAVANDAKVAKTADTLPVVFDGVRYASLSQAHIQDIDLVFLVNRQAQAEGVIYVFRTEDEARAHLTRDMGTLSGNAKFFDGYSGSGYVLEDWPNTYRPDLTTVGRGCILWWCAGNWNDVISSVQTNGSWVKLYEHAYTGGNMLFVDVFVSIPDLSAYGWDDQVSSFVVGP